MKRRTLLIASVGLLGGCLGNGVDDARGSNGTSDDDESNGTDQDEGLNGSDGDHGAGNRNGDCKEDLIINAIYPDEVERDSISHEYIELENDGECAIQVEGFTIDYENGNEYELSDLELEPGGRIVVRSYEQSESVLETDPPVYLRSAGFGDSTITSVMDGSGVVTLRNADGDVIDTKIYEETGAAEGAVEIKYTCPEEVERKYISYEYLRIENTGEYAVDVTGFTVDHGGGNEYTIPELELEEGELLELRSQEGEDMWLAMDPRVNIYHSGFGKECETSVMDGSGLVVLRDREGNVIDDYEYDDTDDEACLR